MAFSPHRPDSQTQMIDNGCVGYMHSRQKQVTRPSAPTIRGLEYSHATWFSVMVTEPPMTPEIEFNCEDVES